jgi:hypothetical protein
MNRGIVGEYIKSHKRVMLSDQLHGDRLTYALAHELGHHIHFHFVDDNFDAKRIEILNRNNNRLPFFIASLPLEDRLHLYLGEVHAFTYGGRLLKKLRIVLDGDVMRRMRTDAYFCYREQFYLNHGQRENPLLAIQQDLFSSINDMFSRALEFP